MSEEDWMKWKIDFSDLDEKSKDKFIREFRDKTKELEKKIGKFDIGDFYNLRNMLEAGDLKERIEKLEAWKDEFRKTEEIADNFKREIKEMKEEQEALHQAITNEGKVNLRNEEVLRELNLRLLALTRAVRGNGAIDLAWLELQLRKLLKKLDGEKEMREESMGTVSNLSPTSGDDSKPSRCFMGDCKDLDCEDIEAQQGIWGKCHEYKPKEKPWTEKEMKNMKEYKEFYSAGLEVGMDIGKKLKEDIIKGTGLTKDQLFGKNDIYLGKCNFRWICHGVKRCKHPVNTQPNMKLDEKVTGFCTTKKCPLIKKSKECKDCDNFLASDGTYVCDCGKEFKLKGIRIQKEDLEKWIWDLKHEISRASIIKKIEKCMEVK